MNVDLDLVAQSFFGMLAFVSVLQVIRIKAWKTTVYGARLNKASLYLNVVSRKRRSVEITPIVEMGFVPFIMALFFLISISALASIPR